ncbi:MAG: superoxide dismutase family protein, partial [Alphaproteobacteria bacterium]|nr:superoxide dismutase family protein [Alphaproteobacteria bacterium]
MKKYIALTAVIFALSAPAMAEMPGYVEVKLQDVKGADAGFAAFTQGTKGLLVKVEAKGLTPGWHGVHFHAMGHCTHDDGFKKAGSHAAKEGEKHGFLSAEGPHIGDLPNLYVAADGTGAAEFYTTTLDMDALPDAAGSALLIHATPDDYKTAPSGESGDRVAC